MALVRSDRSAWPEPIERSLLDWPLRPFEGIRRLLEEDELKIEEFTDGGQLVVRAELPGVDPDQDVDISIVDGSLCIRAERRREEKAEGRDYRRSEIRYGSFSRIVPLPAKAKEEDIQASYHDGLLEVRAPIDQSAAKPSKIPIRRS
jgi:HSP20 family protein